MQYELARGHHRADRRLTRSTDTFTARALAGAVTAAIQAATERWLFADPPVALAPVIEEALRELADGLRDVLPAPSRPAREPARCAPIAAETSEPG